MCLLEGYARFQPANQQQRGGVCGLQEIPARQELRLHHHGRPQVSAVAHHLANESRRRDPNDREGIIFQPHGATNDRRVSRETPLPVSITDDGDWIRAGAAVFLGRKSTP